MDDLSPLLISVFLLIALSLFLHSAAKRTASPVLALLNRWVRWVSLSFSVAYLSLHLGWSERPFWLLASSVFLLWFFLETAFNWLSINALSRSEFPLFPKFRVNTSGQEWPMQKKLFDLRDWLREKGFRKVQALEAQLTDDLGVKCSIFENPERTIRAMIQFFPLPGSGSAVSYSLSSYTRAGSRIITDNSFIPFGGFFPDHFFVLRKPMVRGFPRLLRMHQRRLEKFTSEEIGVWETDPLDEINEQQRLLEKVNMEMGFLAPYEEREEYGRITREGRYRIWKEIWVMNYLGLSRRY